MYPKIKIQSSGAKLNPVAPRLQEEAGAVNRGMEGLLSLGETVTHNKTLVLKDLKVAEQLKGQ